MICWMLVFLLENLGRRRGNELSYLYYRGRKRDERERVSKIFTFYARVHVCELKQMEVEEGGGLQNLGYQQAGRCTTPIGRVKQVKIQRSETQIKSRSVLLCLCQTILSAIPIPSHWTSYSLFFAYGFVPIPICSNLKLLSKGFLILDLVLMNSLPSYHFGLQMHIMGDY